MGAAEQKAHSVKQWGGYDALSVAESNALLEDSDEDGDFIEYEVGVKYDEEGVLSYETVISIFDKRQVIKGIKKMKHDFKHKRRRLLIEGHYEQYRKIVSLYIKAIESKLEDNLRLIANKLGLRME
mmetsp:Transcript_41453/g.30467  ORF Transcript_41453/g.30467 Transcript_41453/m.30467 type:complete len:126 (+) Transcript_41453:506-883(+)